MLQPVSARRSDWQGLWPPLWRGPRGGPFLVSSPSQTCNIQRPPAARHTARAAVAVIDGFSPCTCTSVLGPYQVAQHHHILLSYLELQDSAASRQILP